jgi:hypothetical protein
MDECERVARDYLVHLGSHRVVYEPDGNIPPDFLLDGGIAVEVRRLNQNELVGSDFRGLEETRIPTERKIKKLVLSLGAAQSGRSSWFLCYTLRRPLPAWHQIEAGLRRYLEAFRDDVKSQIPSRVTIEGNLAVELFKASDLHATFFVYGGSCDEDTGGWVFQETQKNLRICIEEKTRKIAPVRHKYPEWWLVLVDRIGYGIEACDRRLFREHLKVEHDLDKVLILSPLDPRSAFEVPGVVSQKIG